MVVMCNEQGLEPADPFLPEIGDQDLLRHIEGEVPARIDEDGLVAFDDQGRIPLADVDEGDGRRKPVPDRN